jgi:hypothetical protein
LPAWRIGIPSWRLASEIVVAVPRLSNTLVTANDNIATAAEVAEGVVGRTYVGIGFVVVTERSRFRVHDILLLVNNANCFKTRVASSQCEVRQSER